MIDHLLQELKMAPFWQKIVLVVLLAILFFYFVIGYSVTFMDKKLMAVDKKRDTLFREVQTIRYLLNDREIIEKNYQQAKYNIAVKIYDDKNFENNFNALLRRYADNIFLYENNNTKGQKYNGLEKKYLQIKARMSERNLSAFLDQANKFSCLLIVKIEYDNNILDLELEYFVNNGIVIRPEKLKAVQKEAPVKKSSGAGKKNRSLSNSKPQIILQGFYISKEEPKAIINNVIYKAGEKCGLYTIIGIYPEKNYVRLRYGQKTLIVRKK